MCQVFNQCRAESLRETMGGDQLSYTKLVLTPPRHPLPWRSFTSAVRLRVQLCRPHFRTALLLLPCALCSSSISPSSIKSLACSSCPSYASPSFVHRTVSSLSYSNLKYVPPFVSLHSIIFIFTFSLCKLKRPVPFADRNLFVI